MPHQKSGCSCTHASLAEAQDHFVRNSVSSESKLSLFFTSRLLVKDTASQKKNIGDVWWLKQQSEMISQHTKEYTPNL